MKTAVEWLEDNLLFEPWAEEHFKHNKECWDKAKEMEQEQGEYNLMDCKRIVHEGFVYVKLNDLLHVKKKFEQ
jgi:hypothetical protein